MNNVKERRKIMILQLVVVVVEVVAGNCLLISFKFLCPLRPAEGWQRHPRVVSGMTP